MRLLGCLKSVQPNKKSNKRDFVTFEKKSAFMVVIWRSCNLFTPVVSVGYIFFRLSSRKRNLHYKKGKALK